MKNFAKKVQRFLESEDGPTAVEYAVMLALIIIVCLSAISAIGTQANTTFSNVAASIVGTFQVLVYSFTGLVALISWYTMPRT